MVVRTPARTVQGRGILNLQMIRLILSPLAAFVLLILMPGSEVRASPDRATTQSWTVVGGQSGVRIHVGKTGLFGFAGHTHEIDAPAVSGQIVFDPAQPERSSVTLTFNAAALTVNPEGEPPDDIAEVQARMLGPDVLDVAQYPTIVFTSTAVSTGNRSADSLEIEVAGDMTLRGATRRLTVPIRLAVTADSLRATGTFRIKQSMFGISPVTAGLGTVRVKDELELSLTIVATPAASAGSQHLTRATRPLMLVGECNVYTSRQERPCAATAAIRSR